MTPPSSPAGWARTLSLLGLCGASGWATGQASAQSPPPLGQVEGEMAALCQRTLAGSNPFFGNQRLRSLEQRLAKPAGDPAQRASELAQFAYEMIRVGDQDRAVEAVERARATVGDAASAETRAYLNALEGVARLQRAEDRNCLVLHDPSSCIVPLAPAAVHREPTDARRAGDLFQQLLEDGDTRINTRWILNIARLVSGDWPDAVPEQWRLPADAFAPRLAAGELPFFVDLSTKVGLDSHSLAGGALVDDFDGDGLLDLISSSWDPCQPLEAWRNDGNGGFVDVAREWGLDSQAGGLNLVHADYDDDGRLDVLVLRGAWFGAEGRIRNSLLRNDLDGETGRFVDVTSVAGLAYPAYPTQAAAWADYDLDGDLDLYIGNESSDVNADPQALDATVPGYPSQLMRNNGDGTFTDVARALGVDDRGFTKGVAWGDYDDDGDPDLYLSNMSTNRLFRNDREAGFRDVTAEQGVAGIGPDGEPVFTFATWFFDYDDDGDLDLFVAGYNASARVIAADYLGVPPPEEAHGLYTFPLLYRNDGDGFTDVTEEQGLGHAAVAMGANFGDLDGDGRLDIYLGTGQPDFAALMPNLALRNTPTGFVNVTFDIGLGHLQKGHGVAFGDVDNDGFEELFHELGGAYPYDAYRNALFDAPERSGNWLVLRLRGTESNHFGVGARIHLRVRKGDRLVSIHRRVDTGGSFGSSSLQQEIALGEATGIEWIEVRWPAGTRTTYRDLELDRFYRLTENPATATPLDVATIELGAKQRPTHSHGEPRP